jgi:hypothetical protein
MSASKRNQRAARNGRTNAQKREAVLTILSDPNLSGLSDREISRRTGVSQPFVSKLRNFVISEGRSTPGSGLITASYGSDNGHSEAVFKPSTLSSYDWATAKRDEQRRFVDGVGLQALFDAAPQGHRDAFLARLLAQLSSTERPEHLPSNIEMYLGRIEGRASGDGLDIPPQFRRSKKEVG